MKLLNFSVGNDQPIFLIAGPCAIESEKIALESAYYLKKLTDDFKINFVYKSSFEKANRSSLSGYTGLGFEKALQILRKVKEEVGCPILTDVHDVTTPFDELNEVVDILQTPAFLCRQTAFIEKVASQGKPVNIKKGQFLSPFEMKNVVAKAESVGNHEIMVCERGFSFGYQNLVVDMRSLAIMKETTGCPVIFDAGHSVQLPGGNGNSSGGMREFIPVLARAAVAVGIAGVFIETHPDPDKALCDGPNMLPLSAMKEFICSLQRIDAAVKNRN